MDSRYAVVLELSERGGVRGRQLERYVTFHCSFQDAIEKKTICDWLQR